MPVLSDFTVIQGDAIQTIGEGALVWEKTFSTAGRLPNQSAILMLMVRGLTQAAQNVDVVINGVVVGHIARHTGANANHWYTQIINVEGGNLNDGENELQLVAVVGDDFSVRDVVCFFHQSA